MTVSNVGTNGHDNAHMWITRLIELLEIALGFAAGSVIAGVLLLHITHIVQAHYEQQYISRRLREQCTG